MKRIYLRDFVIVEQMELDLDAGFTVLTGETGAGKSILIDAVQLALGARADATVVREGADRTEVTVEFDCTPAVAEWLAHAGLEDGETLLLRRTVDLQGRSRAWINGSPVTATQMRDLGDQLLEIHGQHAWQSLTRPHAVRALLDAYANADSHAMATAWQRWRDAVRTHTEAQSAQQGRLQERERLLWQIGELRLLAPQPAEWDDLQARHSRLAHGQTLLDTAAQAASLLEDDDTSATTALSRAEALLRSQAHLDSEFVPLADILASSLAQVGDAVHSLHAYARQTELDPSTLAELDTRLSAWMSLARKYKRPPDQLAGLLIEWEQALAGLDAATDLDALYAAGEQTAQAWRAEAQKVSVLRNKAAPRLAAAVTLAMQGLGMAGGEFAVSLSPSAEPSAAGQEDIAFLVAGHPGASLRPVGKVASGGELSRIALAIAVTTSELGTAQTLIFDEVDSGIGGAVAETVGRLMHRLGKDRQVLAVTHLPQVAACADHHLVVAKNSLGANTRSEVAPVKGERRIGEIARMLGGERQSGATLAHARELLRPPEKVAGR